MNGGPFPIVSVKGNSYARGQEHGSQAKTGIGKNLDTYLRLFEHYSNLDWKQVMQEAERFIPMIEKYDQEIMEEIRGIADGAKREVEEIVALNARYELIYSSWTECTSFAATSDATSSRQTLMGQNWDWSIFLRDSCVILKIEQESKPSILTFTEAGMVGKIGLNSAGIGLCVNGLVSDKDERLPSTPFHVICREILNSKTMSDAIGAVLRAKRKCSANYLIAHKDGEAIDLEATPGDADYKYPTRGILVHANHFTSTRLSIKDRGKVRFPDTLIREPRAKRILSQRYGNIDIKTVQQLLRDHFNYPNSICKHIDERVPEIEQEETVASIIIDLNEKKMYVTEGPPCENTYGITVLKV